MENLENAETTGADDDALAFQKIQARYRKWKARRRRITASLLFGGAALMICSTIVMSIHEGSEDRTLMFKDNTLATVITKVEKSYDIKIQCEDPVYLTKSFSGVFHEDDPIRIVEAVSQSLRLAYTHPSERTFILTPRPVSN
jgi:hypothetical protein